MASDLTPEQVIADALRKHGTPVGLKDVPADEFDCCAQDVAAALRAASFAVMHVTPPEEREPRTPDDPAVLARRIGLRVAGPDEIVVSRAALALWMRVSGVHAQLYESHERREIQAAGDSLRAALSQPPPFNPDVTLIRNLEGNQREMRGYRRDAEEQTSPPAQEQR